MELVIVMGKTCKDVSEEEAMDYVFGHTVGQNVHAHIEVVDKLFRPPFVHPLFF